MRCWGAGGFGRLGHGAADTIGDDETPAAAGPVDLGPGRTVVAISAGLFHTCVIVDTGDVRCWGRSNTGQLGNGGLDDIGDDELPSTVPPVDLGPGRTATAIHAGGLHTCAILDTGQVRCWGFGVSGQLGHGDTDTVGDDETPAAAGPAGLGSGRTALAVGLGAEHTCALLDTGALRCWGLAGSGQLGYAGTGNIGDDESPVSAGPVDLAGPLVTRAASVSLDLQSPVAEAEVGEQTTATLAIVNDGPDPSLVRLAVAGPGLRLVSGTPTLGAFSPDTGLWTIDELGVGQSATLALTAEVLAPGAPVLSARITSQSAADPASFPAPAGAGPGVQVTFTVPEPPPVVVEVPGPIVEVPVPGPAMTVTGPVTTVPAPPTTAEPPLAFTCTLPARRSTLGLPTTATQLAINQRIASAAIRRLNAIRARLEGRPEPVVALGRGGGFRATTTQLRINQRIAEAAFARARAIFTRLGGTGSPTLTPQARTITLTRTGVGTNQLTNIRALDMLNCINANLD